MAEQEQNGVTMPKLAAIKLPVNLFLPSSALRVRSGVKKVRIMPTKKMINVSRSITFGNSKTKKRKASVRWIPLGQSKN